MKFLSLALSLLSMEFAYGQDSQPETVLKTVLSPPKAVSMDPLNIEKDMTYFTLEDNMVTFGLGSSEVIKQANTHLFTVATEHVIHRRDTKSVAFMRLTKAANTYSKDFKLVIPATIFNISSVSHANSDKKNAAQINKVFLDGMLNEFWNASGLRDSVTWSNTHFRGYYYGNGGKSWQNSDTGNNNAFQSYGNGGTSWQKINTGYSGYSSYGNGWDKISTIRAVFETQIDNLYGKEDLGFEWVPAADLKQIPLTQNSNGNGRAADLKQIGERSSNDIVGEYLYNNVENADVKYSPNNFNVDDLKVLSEVLPKN
jgi:hypothetical protein